MLDALLTPSDLWLVFGCALLLVAGVALIWRGARP
jgi:hypothetical protein